MKYTECVVYILAKANQKSQHYLKKRLHPYGLTAAQHLVLQVVMDNEGISPGEIGKLVVYDNATISGILDRLSESGWVRKETDPSDKRITRVYLGKKHKGIEETLMHERKAVNEDLLDKFSDDEQVLLKRFLKDYISAEI